MAEMNSSNIAAAVLSSGGSESLGWLNDILKQMWPNICAAAEVIIKETVEPALAEGLPTPFKGMKFSKISLGSSPPNFDNIDVFTKTEVDSIKLNIDLAWIAEDFEIELETGIVSVGVDSIKIKGRLSILMSPLVNTLPCIGAVQLAFINPPTIDMDFSGIASIADWSFVEEEISNITQSILASMMVLPNRMLTTLMPDNDICRTYKEPHGIVRLTVVEGSDFRSEGGFFRKDVPDTYVITKFCASDKWKTSVQKNTTEPVWNERKDFVFSDDDQLIKIEVWDYDSMSKDDFVGTASATVGQFLLDDDGKKSLKLVADGVEIGPEITLKAEVYKCVPDLLSFELPDFACSEHNICGYMIILIGQGFDIPVPKQCANSCVKVQWGPSQEFVTPYIADTDVPGIDATNPSYDTPFLIPLTQELIKSNKDHDIVFTVKNVDAEEGDEAELGTTSIAFDSIMEASTKTITGDKEPIGDQGLKLRYQVSLRGLSR